MKRLKGIIVESWIWPRCFLTEARVERKFWPEYIKAAAYLKNHTLVNAIEKRILYEIFFGIKLSVKNLRVYGSRECVRIQEWNRKLKWDSKATLGVLRCTDVGYGILISNKVVIVDIIEKIIKCIDFVHKDNIEKESIKCKIEELTGSDNETESIQNQAMEKRIQEGKSDSQKYTQPTHLDKSLLH